jgi:hypothetical protein
MNQARQDSRNSDCDSRDEEDCLPVAKAELRISESFSQLSKELIGMLGRIEGGVEAIRARVEEHHIILTGGDDPTQGLAVRVKLMEQQVNAIAQGEKEAKKADAAVQVEVKRGKFQVSAAAIAAGAAILASLLTQLGPVIVQWVRK